MSNDAPPLPPSTPGWTPPQPPPTKKSHRKRNIVLAIAGVFVVFAALSSTKPSTKTATDSPAATAGPTFGPPAPDATDEPSAATNDTTDPWTTAGWADRFTAYDFDPPESSPLSDGTPRLMMQRASDKASTEAIGDPDNLDRVSLIVGATPDNGEDLGQLMAAFLNTYAPGTRDAAVAKLGKDDDFTVKFDGGKVRVQTLNASDGAIVTVSVNRR